MRLFSAALWRTTAVRLALIYLLVFGAAMGLGLVYVYQATVGVLDRQTRQTIEADLSGLSDSYVVGGLAQLHRTIDARVNSESRRDEVYMLTDRNYNRIAGNLRFWPSNAEPKVWFDFPVTRDEQGQRVNRQVIAMAFDLRGGHHLLVGRDTQSQSVFRRLLLDASFWIGVVTLFVGLGIGLILSRRVLARVDQAALAGESVASGNLDRRLPISGSGDEFDRLATGFNGMLDRIQDLMSGMRIATDSISHDVRRPLTRLRAKLERAIHDDRRDDARTAMGAALEDIDATVLILDNLLKIARAEAGVAGGTWSRIDLAALVQDAVELYLPVAEDKGVTVTTTLQPATITGEPQLLAQAIANLMDNAIKFAPDTGGRIAVASGRDGRFGIVTITDNGPGIPAGDRQRATDRFVRLDDGSRAAEGSGLGLSLVRAVAQMHGGGLDLGDAGPGLRASLRLRDAVEPLQED